MPDRSPLFRHTPLRGRACRAGKRFRHGVLFLFLRALVVGVALLAPAGCAKTPVPEPSYRLPADDLPKWARVRDAENLDPSFTANGLAMPDAARAAEWRRLCKSLPTASDMEKLVAVTRFFNKWPYTRDEALWGVDDYWALPREFALWSGDCEDYAITKFYALRHVGIPAARMRIAAVWNTKRGEGHAVLLVRVENIEYVLDNFTDKVLPKEAVTHYDPVFYVNEETLWVHDPALSRRGRR